MKKRWLPLCCCLLVLLSACGGQSGEKAAPAETGAPTPAAAAQETAAPAEPEEIEAAEDPEESSEPVLPATGLLAKLGLPGDTRVAFADLDGDGQDELCCQYEQEQNAVTEIWAVVDGEAQCRFRESFLLAGAADAGLALLDWRGETLPAYWTGNGEGDGDAFREWREIAMLSPADYQVIRLLRAELINGEPEQFTVEDSVFEPESYTRLWDGAVELLRFQSRYSDELSDQSVAIG